MTFIQFNGVIVKINFYFLLIFISVDIIADFYFYIIKLYSNLLNNITQKKILDNN